MNHSEFSSQLMLDRFSEICAQRPEIETLKYILGEDKILEWVHSIGVSTDHKFRDIAPNVPPFDLRKIVAAPSESVFLWSGLKDAKMCADYFKRFQKKTNSDSVKILDFGCGCGRTTRFLQEIQQFDVYGSDINRLLVNWCQDNLEMVTTLDNDVSPPLKFDDGQFEFVYSLSIFTHLSEHPMLAWMHEMARVVADDGIVLITSHGYPAIDIICQSIQHQQMFQIKEADAVKLHDTFESKQFVYRPLSADIVSAANAGEDYGNSFTHESYIRSRWTSDVFDVIEFVPGGMRGWQDVTILRRLPRP